MIRNYTETTVQKVRNYKQAQIVIGILNPSEWKLQLWFNLASFLGVLLGIKTQRPFVECMCLDNRMRELKHDKSSCSKVACNVCNPDYGLTLSNNQLHEISQNLDRLISRMKKDVDDLRAGIYELPGDNDQELNDDIDFEHY